MWINIIDYRGDDSTVNSRGDTLFNYRTKYFLRQQEDFHYWKSAGHKFRCFTQHENRTALWDDYAEYDDVIKIPRGNAAQSRNRVLDHYPLGEWIGLWDNDATLYWDRLDSARFPEELAQVCDQAEALGMGSFVPFNPQQSPYPPKPKARWTFRPKLEQKGTMLFLKVAQWRMDVSMDALEDLEFAVALVHQGVKTAVCEQVSLKEWVHDKSTVFRVRSHHKAYKRPGAHANPQGLREWHAQQDRQEKYQRNTQYIEQKWGTMRETKRKHQQLWQKPR